MSKLKSAVSMSMHKAGSSITDLILVDFLTEKGYAIDRVANKVSASPLQEPEFFLKYQDRMKAHNVYYGMIRNPRSHDLKLFSNFKVLVQLRDPRDCLTSAYFSYKKSHVPPSNPEKRAEFEQRKRDMRQQDINEFVAVTAENYLMRSEKLLKVIAEYPDVTVLKYEEMVTNTDAWLSKISEWAQQPITESLRDRLGNKIDFSVVKENETRHKRQVTPGDYKRKLKPETIALLNQSLEPALDAFG